MNKRRKEYLKYNLEVYDALGKKLKVGNTVIVNNPYNNVPIIGTLTHFTELGQVAVKYVGDIVNNEKYYWNAYRLPQTVIKFSDEPLEH